ncbi:hypothetical protein [Streptomyces sp. NPDC008150]|uniref:hypothetical protein n=1 Tax=Streptomyces sp. NPDC008150 TaxID=3364816 RepID=UPI0036E07538
MSEPTATGSGPVGPPQHPGAELPYRATALCVVCESYDDVATFPRLKGARGQMLGIAARLRELGFHVRVVGETEDPDLATFRAARDSWRAHWNREGGNGPALILWSGHGVLDGGQLRLALRDLVLSGAVLLLARQSLRAFASGNVGGRGGSGARAEGGEDRRGELEDLWRRATDHPLPPWLDLSEETLSTVSGWLAITSWEDSRAYWEDNAEVLTSEDAATALAEMSLVAPPSPPTT